MSIREFKLVVEKLFDLCCKISDMNIDISGVMNSSLLNYKESKKGFILNQLKTTIGLVKQRQSQLLGILNYGDNDEKIGEIKDIIRSIDLSQINDINILKKKVEKVVILVSELNVPKDIMGGVVIKIPDDIRSEVVEDIKEMKKCFNSKCFRSVVIICGRIIEVILHRKYYETTGKDILEKNPGIGLGKLIAKLVEKNVGFEPGLTQQIHLINQVRVFSVHKKQDPFYPSKAQAEAMMLYTMDVLGKMFR